MRLRVAPAQERGQLPGRRLDVDRTILERGVERQGQMGPPHDEEHEAGIRFGIGPAGHRLAHQAARLLDERGDVLPVEPLTARPVREQAQPDRPNASARIQYHVTGAPEGDIDYYWIYENGRIAEAKCGELSDPDFTVTLSYEDSSKIQQGELEPNAAFMQGRMKVTGQLAKMMALMPITSSSEYKALQEKLRTITTY